jgi:hypothetical protein
MEPVEFLERNVRMWVATDDEDALVQVSSRQ